MERRQFLTSLGVGTASAALTQSPLPTALAATFGTAIPLVAARPAESVCQNYMINTKIFHKEKVYRHTDAVVDLVKELGARIVRERITTTTSAGTKAQLYAMPRLARAGVRWHPTVGDLSDWRQASAVNKEVMTFLAQKYAPLVGGDLSALLHSLGGCNEIDGIRVGDPYWPEHGRIMQKALWAQAKANPKTARIPVAGPSTGSDINVTAAKRLGDLSAWSDIGNGHLFNRGTSPSRQIDDHLAVLRYIFPDANKWIMTETGYNNSPQDNKGYNVPEFASAIYATRGICDFFKRNTVYGAFELLDDPDRIDYSSQTTINQTADREAHFGLIAMTKDSVTASTPDTWRKKPEFYAIKRFLALLSDRGQQFAPSGLRYTVAGGGSDLQQILVQKRSGKHYLILWRDVVVSTRYPTGRSISVAADGMTLRMESARPVAIYMPGKQTSPIRTYSARTSVPLDLGRDLQVVEIG